MPKQTLGLDPLHRLKQVGLKTDLNLTPELSTGLFRLFPMVMYVAPWRPIHLGLWSGQEYRGDTDPVFPYYPFNPASGLNKLNFEVGGTQLQTRKFLQSQVEDLHLKAQFGEDLEEYAPVAELLTTTFNTPATMNTDPAWSAPGWDANSQLSKGPFYMHGYLKSLLTDSTTEGVDFEGKFYQSHTHYADFENILTPISTYNFSPLSTYYRPGTDPAIGVSGLMECCDIMRHNYDLRLRYRAQDDKGNLVSQPVVIKSVETKGLTVYHPETYTSTEKVLGDLNVASVGVNWDVSWLDHELRFKLTGMNEVGYLDYHDEVLRVEILHTGLNEIYYEFFLRVVADVGGIESVGWMVVQLNDLAIVQNFS